MGSLSTLIVEYVWLCTDTCSVLGVNIFIRCLATELESSAKKEFSKAEDKVMSKVPESVGGNKIELYSGRYYATCAVGGAVACGATHTFGGFSRLFFH